MLLRNCIVDGEQIERIVWRSKSDETPLLGVTSGKYKKARGEGKREKEMFTFKKAFTEEVKVSRAEEVLKGAVQHMAGIQPEDEE